ncbi:MAG: Teichoic acids export ATP-binding protein TagH [bacterium ADurb.Bin363]|nr:MAG: Teichoic acids export ATP-binding protein TagH [bacterium ADurb.Bin363]
MNDIAIKIENLSKVYRLYNNPVERLKESLHPFRKKYHREFYALRDVSFEVKRGETVGIIGKNGSGKSTLLKIITGVLTPTGGNVTVNGKVSALLELGTGFNPEFTGMENIYFSGTIMGYTKEEIDKKVDEIVSFADIGDFINQPVKIYSSGMYVRLAFAVAINVDPEILIIDEALSVGDIAFQVKCFRKFNEFKEAGKTILFVTHSLDSILRYCNKGIVIQNGIKITETDPKDAVDVYKRLLVDCYGEIEDKNSNREDKKNPDLYVFKEKFSINPDLLSYGNNKAEIIDFGIFDEYNNPTQKLLNNQKFSIKMKVRFNEEIGEPIFAYTIKDLKGLEITGTNTMYKKMDMKISKKNDMFLVEFFQMLNIQAGQYALSLGCTGYEGEEFVVYHRLYDVILFEVVSDVLIVGFYDLHSEIRLNKLNAS